MALRLFGRRKKKESVLYRRLQKQAHPVRRFNKALVLTMVGVGLIGAGGMTTYAWVKAPKLTQVFKSSQTKMMPAGFNINYLDNQGHSFYQSDGGHYERLHEGEIKKNSWATKALVATEDRQFFKEGGVNWPHTMLAGLRFFKNDGSATGGGGSTITQQLIKLTFFSTAVKDRTVMRKLQEMKLAEELNHKYSKMTILKWYFDTANFGNGQQGLVAASKYYYGKRPGQLDAVQAATLIGMVNSPAQDNPYLNEEQTKARRNLVLKSMRECRYLSADAYENDRETPLKFNMKLAKTNVKQVLKDRDQQLEYNGFISGVNAQLSRYDHRLTGQSMTVKTTMNKQLQDQVDQIVGKYKYPDDKIQEAIVVIDNKTGAVQAMSGGRQATVLGGYNRAFNGRRSSGSSIKPILDYAPAIDILHWGTDTTIDDSSFKYPGTNQEVNDWDHQHMGKMSIQDALIKSRNIPAVKALLQVGLDNGSNVLDAQGFGKMAVFAANAIGVDTNPLTMASAYTALANGGVRTNPRLWTSVENANHKMTLGPQREQVYSPQSAFMTTKMLEQVFSPQGTGMSAKIDGISAAGKTGTVGRGHDTNSDALTDSWMVGYTKSHTVAVWVGYDNPNDPKEYLTNQKANIALDLYKQTMQAVQKQPGFDGHDWSTPNGVSQHGNAWHLDNGTDTSNDFRKAENRLWSRLPGRLNMNPWYFMGGHIQPDKGLNKIYQNVQMDDEQW